MISRLIQQIVNFFVQKPDEIPPEVQQRFMLFMRIPNEVWTDVLKLLPRRILVQQISPACYLLKEICNKNVKNIHVIENANRFTEKLKWDDPEANQQLEHLAANKCQLASQFRLSYFRVCEKSSKVILRHCRDLFRGCQIAIYPNTSWENEKLTFIEECLSILEASKPVKIIDQEALIPGNNPLLLPTVQKCSRVEFTIWMGPTNANHVIAFENIFDWLHHQPKGVDNDIDGATDQQQVRCMITTLSAVKHIELFLNRCSRNIQEGREPSDRRPFVLSFWVEDWPGFSQFHQIENKSTGEVLVLDRVVDENGETSGQYRLRRCLAEDEADGPDYYAGMFKREDGYEKFKIEGDTPRVIIR